MPSTATTNVTISTLLDLIGPTAPAPAAGKDQPAFDSLLQPAPPPALPSPPIADERPASKNHNESTDSPHSSPPAPASEEQTGESSHDESHPRSDSISDATPSSNSRTKPAGEIPGQQDQPHESEAVIAESLAGLAAIVPTAATAIPTAKAVPVSEVKAQETTESGIATGKEKVAQQQTTAVQVAATKTAADAAQGEHPKQAESNSSAQIAHPSAAGTLTGQQIAGKPSVSEEPKNNHGVTALADKSADEPTTSNGHDHLTVADALQPQPSSSHQQQRENPQSADAPAVKLDATAVASAATDPSAATPVAAPPTIAAQAAQLPVVDSASNASGSAPTSSVANSAAAPRSRLPADVLTQPASGPNRRPNVEVDATRLLSRVARAFTAAQERDGEIRLRLSPPELGSIRLDVRIQDGALVAHLQTETDAARTAILDNLPALRDRLSEQGMRIERFDVDLMQRQPGGMPDQTGGGRQDMPTTPLRVAPPPRQRVETISTLPSSPAAGSTDGLNVII